MLLGNSTSPRTVLNSNRDVRELLYTRTMGYTQRINPPITRRDARPGRGPAVFVQRRPFEPDRLPKV